MRHSTWLIGSMLILTACGGSDFSAADQTPLNGGGNSGSGGGTSAGTSGTGGTVSVDGGSSAGTGGSGATTNTGGTAGSGGMAGAGGTPATGGTIGAGGTIGTGGTGGGPTDIHCTGDPVTFPTFDRTCVSDGDCVLVWHTTDCCGGQLAMGINQDAKSAFEEAEQICASQYPACGCAASTFDMEDGTVVPLALQDSAVAACHEGQCRSEYGGNRFTCGTTECADFEFCETLLSGPAGTDPTYSCGLLPVGCSDCSCAGAVIGAGCQCSGDGGQVIVTCATP